MYNNSKEKLQELLHDFEKWITRMMHLDETEMSKQVKDNLLRYARNVAVGLSKNYGMVREGVDAFMGGVVSRYSPVEQEIHDGIEAGLKVAVEAAEVNKTLSNMCKYYAAGKFTLQEAAQETNLTEEKFLENTKNIWQVTRIRINNTNNFLAKKTNMTNRIEDPVAAFYLLVLLHLYGATECCICALQS